MGKLDMLQSTGLQSWMGLRDCTTITNTHEQKCLPGRHLRTRRLLNFSAVLGQREPFLEVKLTPMAMVSPMDLETVL